VAPIDGHWFPRHAQNEMDHTRFDNPAVKHQVDNGPNPETALFLAASAFGLAMLSLLAVLALADFVGPAHILPFFAFPLVLFIASAPLLRRWMKGEADEAAVREVPHRSSKRPPSKLRPTPTDGVDTRRQALKPTSAVRR
jgi:hypothetical protein